MRVFDLAFPNPARWIARNFRVMFSALASRASRWSCPGRLLVADRVDARISPPARIRPAGFCQCSDDRHRPACPTQPGTYDIELLALEFIGDRLQLTHVLVVFILLWCALVSLYLWMGIWQVARQWQREARPGRSYTRVSAATNPRPIFAATTTSATAPPSARTTPAWCWRWWNYCSRVCGHACRFVVLELVASPWRAAFTGQSLPHEVQVEFAERLKRYTKDDIGWWRAGAALFYCARHHHQRAPNGTAWTCWRRPAHQPLSFEMSLFTPI